MPRSRSCRWIATRPPPVPPAARGSVRDESVQPQHRLSARCAERVPALSGPHEQVEVVLVGVRVVEVAGRAVRRAVRVSAREPLEHEWPLAPAGQRPRGRQAHHASADHDDGHAFVHLSIFAGRRPRGSPATIGAPDRRVVTGEQLGSGSDELGGAGCRSFGIRLHLGRDRGRTPGRQPERDDHSDEEHRRADEDRGPGRIHIEVGRSSPPAPTKIAVITAVPRARPISRMVELTPDAFA